VYRLFTIILFIRVVILCISN